MRLRPSKLQTLKQRLEFRLKAPIDININVEAAKGHRPLKLARMIKCISALDVDGRLQLGGDRTRTPAFGFNLKNFQSGFARLLTYSGISSGLSPVVSTSHDHGCVRASPDVE